MASLTDKLTDKMVRALGEGRYGDGRGLYLLVAASGARSWMLRYQIGGKRRDMGLGSYPSVTLAAARALAADARTAAKQGVDPIARREGQRKAQQALPTFADIAALTVADMQAQSTNAKVRYQAARHLGPAYCKPILNRPVNEITSTDLAAVLRPVWSAKPEVARKLYAALRRVFERARVNLKDHHGIVLADNPADWEYLKAQGFERPKALSRGRHPSLAYDRMPEFMAALRQRDASAARLMEFAILTNTRTGSAIGARWAEFDLDNALWAVPLARLKDGKHRTEPFRVPLSPRVVELLRELDAARTSDFVFPSAHKKSDAPLSNMAMLVLLGRMNEADGHRWKDDVTGKPITVHGFRATFRTWAEEAGRFAHSVVEEAMGHAVGTQVERAYRRTDVLALRRELMTAWAAHCEPGAGGNVVQFSKAGA